MGEFMKSYPVIGGPLDGKSQTILNIVNTFKVLLGQVEMTSLGVFNDRNPAPASSATSTYEYVRASFRGDEAFVPSDDNDLLERFQQCGPFAVENRDPIAMFLEAEIVRRAIKGYPAH